MIAKWILLVLCFAALRLNAQDEALLFNQLFDEIFISPDDVENLEEIYQQLYHYYQHPINLNKATADDFK